jgi:hypothetical protein
MLGLPFVGQRSTCSDVPPRLLPADVREPADHATVSTRVIGGCARVPAAPTFGVWKFPTQGSIVTPITGCCHCGGTAFEIEGETGKAFDAAETPVTVIDGKNLW